MGGLPTRYVACWVGGLTFAVVSVAFPASRAHSSSLLASVADRVRELDVPVQQKTDSLAAAGGAQRTGGDTAASRTRDTTVQRTQPAGATGAPSTTPSTGPGTANGWPLIVAAVVFGLLLVITVPRFFVAVASEEGAAVEAHWGGFGGGLGGWRLSPALMYLLAIVFFGGLFTTTLHLATRRSAPPQQQAGGDTAKASAADKPGATT